MPNAQYAPSVTEQQLTIRGIDMELWRKVRQEAVGRGIPAGELVNTIFREWLERQDTTK